MGTALPKIMANFHEHTVHQLRGPWFERGIAARARWGLIVR
jgi:hypothetical protein